MTTEWSVPLWAAVATVGVLVILLVLAVVLALRGRMLARRRIEAAEAATAELRSRLETLEARTVASPASASGSGSGARTGVARREPEFVITSLGATDPEGRQPAVPALPPRAFADAVLRDTVVNTAAFVHGVRRALSPQVRNRIRFEMKRELKRTRKERKVEVREALREYRARHRAETPTDVPGDLARGDVA